MRWAVLISVIAIVLIIIALAVFNPFSTGMVTISEPQGLVIDLAVENVANPGAELLLLEDRQPVKIEAIIKNPFLEEGRKSVKELLRWSASAGRLVKDEGLDNKWFPPQFSTTAVINVELQGEYSSAGWPFFRRKTRIKKQAEVKLLSPTSGKHLKNGRLEDFELGEYLDPEDKQLAIKYRNISQWVKIFPRQYKPPEFFYKVTNENKGLKVSPHFQLKQFILDFPWFTLGLPQYIALDFGLVQKLENLITLMNQDGFNIKTFELVYGFRPPSFNITDIEDNPDVTLKVPFSMHMYGKAADVIIDRDDDLVMDDLNKDGRIDINDAAVILKYVDRLDRDYLDRGSRLVGGAGVYSHHDFTGRVQTPYVHVDIRGFTTPEGRLIRWRID